MIGYFVFKDYAKAYREELMEAKQKYEEKKDDAGPLALLSSSQEFMILGSMNDFCDFAKENEGFVRNDKDFWTEILRTYEATSNDIANYLEDCRPGSQMAKGLRHDLNLSKVRYVLSDFDSLFDKNKLTSLVTLNNL